ncbi:MAG: carbonate dehydratase [Bacteroidetes bacterium]|nr:carbonate dehydratase [Bacteroidota bacterium]
MSDLKHLFENNRNWAKKIEENEPGFFKKLSRQQNPEYLWIGCSDSRVPANEIVDLLPGELFVHRNVANIVVHTDLNCLSVIQYAVDFLKVKHIIVCGHYSCGGVKEAFKNSRLGLIDNWLRHTQDVAQKHKHLLSAKTDQTQAIELLCELNVIEQVQNVCQTTIVQQAWERKQDLTVHGWIYGLNDGLIKDLNINVKTAEELDSVYDLAIRSLD